MKDMIKAMVQEMVMQSIKEVMSEMLGGATEAPAVATATAPARKTQAPTLSREELLAQMEAEMDSVPTVEREPLELVNITGTQILKFNYHPGSDLWTANWLSIREHYPSVRYDKQTHGFRWNKADSAEFFAACRSYQVITELTPEIKHNIKIYKQEKARKRAEYYAQRAQD